MNVSTHTAMRQVAGALLQTCGWLLLLMATVMFLLGILAFAAVPFPFLAPGTASAMSALFLLPVAFIPLAIGLVLGGDSLRKHRFQSCRCPTCGYDLRVRTGNVCPECGSPC